MTSSITAHSYFIFLYERDLRETPLTSKMKLFVVVCNGFYPMLIG